MAVYISSFRLHNFRNFEKFAVEFSSGLNIIVGPNGAGKSNLLEAIGLLAVGKSFRSAKLKYLIKQGQKQSVSEGVISTGDLTKFKLAVSLESSGRKLLFNGKSCLPRDFFSRFQAVIFSPRHLDIITDSPALRRAFLDDILVGLSSEYEEIVGQYRHVLHQRNKLLSQARDMDEQMAFWNQKLVSFGGMIIVQRYRLVQELNCRLSQWKLKLDYYPSPRVIRRELESGWEESQVQELIRNKLKQTQEREREMGFTLIGPQRDEVKILGPIIANGSVEDLSFFGSRGQQRLAVVRLKTGQLDLMEEKLGQRPVFVCDDIFSELDNKAREALLPSFTKQQTLITAVTQPEILKEANMIDLRKTNSKHK
ncbi:DNA replication and repair protein RecF [Patescibacteria group bacterium]|nr:DNA replication and repair protein RecF [Patescibacteria group bacterium]